MTVRPTPDELSRQLRHGSSPSLQRRRGIVSLSFIACGALAAVALYQVGILKKLPQPRGRFFDTERVNGSGEAYSRFGAPDAFLGLVSYAVTATLAGIGGEKRSQTRPWLPLAMGMKLLADSAVAAKLTFDECRKFGAFSLWSVVTAVATWSALPLALPEARAALLRLKGYNDA